MSNLVNKLYADSSYASRVHGSIAFALNKTLDSTKTKIVNEEGFRKICSISNNFTINGAFATNSEVIMFLTDTSYSYIDILDIKTEIKTTCIKTLNSNPYSLNFNIENPIIGYPCYNGKNELLLVFADGITLTSNELKFLNCTDINLPSGLNGNFEPNVYSELELLKVTKLLPTPIIQYNESTEDGYLETGSYIVTISYKILDVITGCLNYSNPITIIKDNFIHDYILEQDYNSISGSKSGITSNKSINLTLNDVPYYVKELQIGIEYVKSSVKLYYKNIVPFSNISKTIKIQGLSDYTLSTYDTVFKSISKIEKVNAITNFDNKSIIGNFTIGSQIKYQPFANNIKVYWTTKLCTYGGFSTGINSMQGQLTYKNDLLLYKDKSFLPEEVYALYISLIDKKGIETDKFLISGRGRFAEWENSITAITEELMVDSAAKKYQLRSTMCEYQGTQSTIDDVETIDYSGNLMGFWENEDEYYLNTEDWDIYTVKNDGTVEPSKNTLRNKKVRHHRMPSQSVIETDESGSFLNSGYETNNSKPILGLRLEDINFPIEILNQIQGYRIYYAKRSLENSTIQDEIVSEYIFTNDTKPNYPDLGSSILSSMFNNSHFVRNQIIVNPFHTLKDNNPLIFSYLKVNYKFKSTYYQGTTPHEDGFNIDNVDTYNAGTDATNWFNRSLFTDKEMRDDILFVTDKNYIVPNQTINNVYNKGGQNNILINTNKEIFDIVDIETSQFFNASLCIYKKNIYYPYDNTELIPLTDIIKTNTDFTYNTETYNGDVFIGLYANRQTKLYYNVNTDIYTQYNKIFLCPFYSNSHIELRHLETNDYLPLLKNHPSDFYKFMHEPVTYYSPYSYNRDISYKLNIVSIIYNHLNKFKNHFPFRLMISNPNTTEGNGIGISEFEPNSYIDTEGIKGAIVSLNASPYSLFIQKEFTLNVINLKSEIINGDSTEISINQQDIFNVQIDEIVNSELGFICTTERFANVVTPFGYFVFDNSKNLLFMSDGKEAKDITIGIKSEIDKLETEIKSLISNPLLSQGIVLGYNPIENVLLLTILTLGYEEETDSTEDSPTIYSKSITLSYDLTTKSWLSFHNYYGKIYINNSFKLISIKNNIYTHNDSTCNCKFYTNNNDNLQRYFSDIIDYRFNSIVDKYGELKGGESVKLLKNFEINSELYRNNIIQFNESINSLMIYNETQCSNTTAILPIKKTMTFKDYGYRHINNILYYNNFKDLVINNHNLFLDSKYRLVLSNLTQKNYLHLSKFISKFVVLRLTHNNSSTSKELLYINSIVTNFTILKQ